MSKAPNELSYRPSAYYWRLDIRNETDAVKLVQFIRDLGQEVVRHDATLLSLGVLPEDDGLIVQARLTTRGTKAALRRAAERLVVALEEKKAQIRALGCIPPKCCLSPSEAKAKPHLLG